jgi:hypothetical protein
LRLERVVLECFDEDEEESVEEGGVRCRFLSREANLAF